LADLYFGPKTPDFWREEYDDPDAADYSFLDSCKVISEWFSSVEWPSYIDEDGHAIEDDQDAFDGTDIIRYEVDPRGLKHNLFGELASYL
jgi:hypothetical protein